MKETNLPTISWFLDLDRNPILAFIKFNFLFILLLTISFPLSSFGGPIYLFKIYLIVVLYIKAYEAVI